MGQEKVNIIVYCINIQIYSKTKGKEENNKYKIQNIYVEKKLIGVQGCTRDYQANDNILS